MKVLNSSRLRRALVESNRIVPLYTGSRSLNCIAVHKNLRHAMEPDKDYSAWSNEQLIRRVTELEAQLKRQNAKWAIQSIVKPVYASLIHSTASNPALHPRYLLRRKRRASLQRPSTRADTRLV